MFPPKESRRYRWSSVNDDRLICKCAISPSNCISYCRIRCPRPDIIHINLQHKVNNNNLHSTSNSSSHARKVLLHFQASTPSSHPNSNICPIVNDLFYDKSNKRRKRTWRVTSPTHLSLQNNVLDLFSTFKCKWSGNQVPTAEPTPSGTFTSPLVLVKDLKW